ncbi:MAG: NADH:flavin oxidoreductase [Bryobacteraceae bacterium]|jgi:2,4-dienoyl-CoA reductase-like NADH-dependent reductase (Old Yellow Enzyme family)
MSAVVPPDISPDPLGDRAPVLNRSTEKLFRSFQLKGLKLANRIVMAPMTRSHSPEGVPGAEVAAYYRRRAEGEVGLIITEGTFVDHPAAGFDPKVPHFYGELALAGWRRVAEEVHQAGGLIFPQLWHVGMVVSPGLQPREGIRPIGPSGFSKPGERTGEPMTQADIDAVIEAFAKGASDAKDLGFDGVELHGAHGYLIDQFFWDATNQRSDKYGGDLVSRTRFAAEIVGEVRRRVGAEFPVVLRWSQWKLQDFEAKLARNPEELERFLRPLVDAGVDAFHCSTRRFWEPEFAGSDLNLAGWTKKLTGKPVITVGSVTLNEDLMTSFGTTNTAGVTGIDNLLERLGRDEFDLVAIGRSLIVNPTWPGIVRRGALSELRPFNRSVLVELV